ncbi:GlsB/YeaQ/YmgE family stress response membrane protein [Singulisphaera rosea]
MWIVGYAIFGLVAGAIARMVHPGRDPMNWFWTMLLGIGGAELGGYAAREMGYDPSTGITDWIAAIAGAVVLLIAYHALTAPGARVANDAGPATNDDYKRAVMDDLSRGPNG